MRKEARWCGWNPREKDGTGGWMMGPLWYSGVPNGEGGYVDTVERLRGNPEGGKCRSCRQVSKI